MLALATALLGLLLAVPSEDEADRPHVRILESRGALEGPSEGGVALPTWEHVRVELRVTNQLPVPVRDLEVEVSLVLASGAGSEGAAPIPGWSFREVLAEPEVPAGGEAYLRIARELPSRRTSPRAEDIAYRARIHGYRLARPDVDTALRLLGSNHRSDQVAALRSYELPPETERARVAELGRGLVGAATELPDDPGPSDALRVLFAIRALGTIGDAASVRTLLELPDRGDGRRFARAVAELAATMAGASEADAPRLRVLPPWAREGAQIRFRAIDALEEAVRDAVLRMGDLAVPGLLAEAHVGSTPGVRVRAQRLLHALGRATVRSQLAVKDREARLAVIAVLGTVGGADAVTALAELLRGHDHELREAAMKAIEHIGPAAIDPLIAALGTRNDEATASVLKEVARGRPAVLARAAARYGVQAGPKEDAPALLDRLRQHLAGEQRARLQQELEHALELGREGSYNEAFQRFDQVFAQDPDLYMSRAADIAAIYLQRGRRLATTGDYDAAIASLRTALSIRPSPEASDLLLAANLQLARGLLELGDLDRADETLHDADPRIGSDEGRALEARLLALRANQALANGDYGKASRLVERARALRLTGPELDRTARRLVIAGNLVIIIALALVVPAAGLSAVLVLRRRREARRMVRLAGVIDRGETPGE